jgi:hypothetical protein
MVVSDLPPDLRKRIESFNESRHGFSNVGFEGTIPDERPEMCPDCGSAVRIQTVFVDDDETTYALRLVCWNKHESEGPAHFIYALDDDVLYRES